MIDMKFRKRYESGNFSGIFSFEFFKLIYYISSQDLISNFFIILILINTKWLLPFDIHFIIINV